jgi:hypothetical protein
MHTENRPEALAYHFGLAFIKALNCLNPPAPGEFCDQCFVAGRLIPGLF